LFNTYLEERSIESEDIGLNGTMISGEEINMLRFAENIAIIAEKYVDLQTYWIKFSKNTP
jgi:hypothetical protein